MNRKQIIDSREMFLWTAIMGITCSAISIFLVTLPNPIFWVIAGMALVSSISAVVCYVMVLRCRNETCSKHR